ncbi:MAG: multiheme c-type cytochrome [Halobacteriovoraceae bacterium]|nr:multiheme c-type cytochrome [Halobacteriovoraceae bacterium]
MSKITGVFLAGGFLVSCSFLIDRFQDAPWFPVSDKPALSLVFSHNINGETHPCGCRNYPLGGLPQVAGKIASIKKRHDVVYVDTGDTFYSSTIVPAQLRDSSHFAAKNMAAGLERLGLDYYVPGEQDFALGEDFLQQLSQRAKFTFLVANFRKKSIKHKKWVVLTRNNHHFFLTGVVDPGVMPQKYRALFTPVASALKKVLLEMKREGFLSDNPFHRLVVLSHTGMSGDESLAAAFPQIDWIIGSHSQSFTRNPVKEKNTRLVQVLSRNHYLGEIIFSLTGTKGRDSFKLHEIHDKLKDEIKPNPFFSFIDNHKNKIKEIQIKEQGLMEKIDSNAPLKTAISCMECHTKQAEHWYKTHHSIAYLTLIKNNEEKNLACLKCHTLGLNDPRGYKRAEDLIRSEKKLPFDYWRAFTDKMKFNGSVRELSPQKTSLLAKRWLEFDQQHKVSYNYSNVQCLNCHTQHPEHPFDSHYKEITDREKKNLMREKCISCHNGDQSPHWYVKNKKGLAGDIDDKKLSNLIKKIGCPAM